MNKNMRNDSNILERVEKVQAIGDPKVVKIIQQMKSPLQIEFQPSTKPLSMSGEYLVINQT